MIKKEELNELGFRRFINDKVHFSKAGWLLWSLEVEPGNIYAKVAICKDNDAEKNGEYTYFHDIGALKRFLEKNESITKAKAMWDTPYPAPANYNESMYHSPES